MDVPGAAESEDNIRHDPEDQGTSDSRSSTPNTHEQLNERSQLAQQSGSDDNDDSSNHSGDNHENSNDNEGNEEEAEEDDEEEENGSDGEDEEPRFKYANLTKKLGSLYRNGDATSSLLTAGDKMVCAPRVVYCCEGSRELTSSRLDNWNT